MIFANKTLAAACLAATLMATGCSQSSTPAAAPASTTAAPASTTKQYAMKGEIMGLDAPGKTATIKHENIEGFMGAMTMGYPVKDPAEFSKLKVGEKMTATVYVNGDDMWVGDIKDASDAKPEDKK